MKLTVTRGDITKLDVDAIVNSKLGSPSSVERVLKHASSHYPCPRS